MKDTDLEEGTPIEQLNEKKPHAPLHTDRKFIRLCLIIFLAVLVVGGGVAYYLNTLPAPPQDAAVPITVQSSKNAGSILLKFISLSSVYHVLFFLNQ